MRTKVTVGLLAITAIVFSVMPVRGVATIPPMGQVLWSNQDTRVFLHSTDVGWEFPRVLYWMGVYLGVGPTSRQLKRSVVAFSISPTEVTRSEFDGRKSA